MLKIKRDALRAVYKASRGQPILRHTLTSELTHCLAVARDALPELLEYIDQLEERLEQLENTPKVTCEETPEGGKKFDIHIETKEDMAGAIIDPSIKTVALVPDLGYMNFSWKQCEVLEPQGEITLKDNIDGTCKEEAKRYIVKEVGGGMLHMIAVDRIRRILGNPMVAERFYETESF